MKTVLLITTLSVLTSATDFYGAPPVDLGYIYNDLNSVQDWLDNFRNGQQGQFQPFVRQKDSSNLKFPSYTGGSYDGDINGGSYDDVGPYGTQYDDSTSSGTNGNRLRYSAQSPGDQQLSTYLDRGNVAGNNQHLYDAARNPVDKSSEYPYPLYPINPQRPAVDPNSQGQFIPIQHYPIDIPASVPSQQYPQAGGGPYSTQKLYDGPYPAQKRQILPSPYSSSNVPYANPIQGPQNTYSQDVDRYPSSYGDVRNPSPYDDTRDPIPYDDIRYPSSSGNYLSPFQENYLPGSNNIAVNTPLFSNDYLNTDLSRSQVPPQYQQRPLQYPPSSQDDYTPSGSSRYPLGGGFGSSLGGQLQLPFGGQFDQSKEGFGDLTNILPHISPVLEYGQGDLPRVAPQYDPLDGYGSLGLPRDAPQYSYPSDVYNYRQGLKCAPEFFFEYTKDFSGPIWQDVKGDVYIQNGHAVFQGHGAIAVPFFACNDLLPRYTMSFVIGPAFSRTPQAIIGNSLYGDKASLLVSISGNTLRLTVKQRPAGLTPEQLLTACKPSVQKRSAGLGGFYGNADLGQGLGDYSAVNYGSVSAVIGEVIVLELNVAGVALVTITQEDDWIFFSAGGQQTAKRGRLPLLTNEALYVGAGADPLRGTTLAGYTGTFDSFLFEKCPKGR